MYDLCVVGAGVSGMAAAISAAAGGLSVALIEKNKKIGNKIYATGNGKCNLTNTYINVNEHYNSTDEAYAGCLDKLYFAGAGVKAVLSGFFEAVGIAVYADSAGYVYPCSNQASSVVWAMKDALDKYKVEVITNAEVTRVSKAGNCFSVSYEHSQGDASTLASKYVLLACGGRSYPKLGGSDKGYALASQLGHTLTDIFPALCGLKTKSLLHSAEGVRVRTTAQLFADGKKLDAASGEIQLTSYGLSGIAIFNLSSKAVRYINSGKRVDLGMNLIDNLEHGSNTVNESAVFLKAHCKGRTIFGALNGITNEKLALYALEKQGVYPKEKMHDIPDQKLEAIINELKNYRCQVTGFNDYDMAQVTAGGVCLSEVDMESFESKLVPGLYVTGEMLDIDGICGGYNITFALVSGITAARCMTAK